MPRIEPPPDLVLPSIPYDALPRQEKLGFLRSELIRATQVVAYSDQIAEKSKELAQALMQSTPTISASTRRTRELILEAERSLGLRAPAPGADVDEERRTKRILLGRRLLAGGRAMRRDSRRYRWRVAQRLAETEAKGEG